jgi:hypothetical protein
MMDNVYRELCASQGERCLVYVSLLRVFSFEQGFLALCMNNHIVMLTIINQKWKVASIQIYIIRLFLCDARLWVSVFWLH